MSFQFRANKQKLIKYSLFAYTAIIFSISLIAATSLINTTNENPAYNVLADNCPGGSVGTCVDSCVWGCNQPGQPYPTECAAGCQAACQNNCATSGPRCGDGSCANGETWYNCPSDCQDQRPPVDDRGPVDVPTSPPPSGNNSGKGDGSVAIGASCDSASDCYGVRCEYPLNTYCQSNGTCGCVAPANQTVNACDESQGWTTISTVSCGAGQVQCSPGEAGCTHIGDTIKSCNSCGNPSVFPVYCRAVTTSVPPGTPPPTTPPPPPPPPVNTASVYIDKRLAEDRVYRIGDVVTFLIRIGNNGNTTFNTVRFRDRYETAHLSFINGSATKSTGESVTNISSLFSSHANGEIIINDLTSSILGDLAPGQYYDITLRFTALTPTPANDPACNNAYVRPDNLPEEGDDACAPVENRDTDL